MKAVLSSFCFNTVKTDAVRTADWAYSMPPVCFRSIGASFRPDYSIFFLCDAFYIDEVTISRVSVDPMFKEHKALFDALKDTGRLKIIDYRQVVAPHDELIESSFRADLADLSRWRDSFMQLVDLWEDFTVRARQSNHFGHAHVRFGEEATLQEMLSSVSFEMVRGMLDRKVRENLRNWKKALPEEYRQYTRDIVAPYLKHVSSTLCLADSLEAVLHDWSDIGPLYRQKLTESARPGGLRDQDRQDSCRQLIQIMFPDFVPRTSKSLAKALDDSRVEGLRRLVDDAVLQRREFDSDFAAATIRDVLAKEQLIGKYRNLVGWLTMPLSLIPWAGSAVEKGAQIATERLLKNHLQRQNGWFMWLSDVNRPQDIAPAARKR
jgi:hypothetical protein